MSLRHVFPRFVAASLIAALAGCQFAVLGIGGAAVVSVEDRRPTRVQVNDETSQVQATSRIGERLGAKAHVNVTSYNGVLLLTGEVQDARMKSELEKIVAELPNVRAVANEVEVSNVSALSARTVDSVITSKVKARFLDSGKFNPIRVKVVTEAGLVYLMGIVTEAEAEDAVELARTTDGVRKVVKIFEYCRMSGEVCMLPSAPGAAAPKPEVQR